MLNLWFVLPQVHLVGAGVARTISLSSFQFVQSPDQVWAAGRPRLLGAASCTRKHFPSGPGSETAGEAISSSHHAFCSMGSPAQGSGSQTEIRPWPSQKSGSRAQACLILCWLLPVLVGSSCAEFGPEGKNSGQVGLGASARVLWRRKGEGAKSGELRNTVCRGCSACWAVGGEGSWAGWEWIVCPPAAKVQWSPFTPRPPVNTKILPWPEGWFSNRIPSNILTLVTAPWSGFHCLHGRQGAGLCTPLRPRPKPHFLFASQPTLASQLLLAWGPHRSHSQAWGLCPSFHLHLIALLQTFRPNSDLGSSGEPEKKLTSPCLTVNQGLPSLGYQAPFFSRQDRGAGAAYPSIISPWAQLLSWGTPPNIWGCSWYQHLRPTLLILTAQIPNHLT